MTKFYNTDERYGENEVVTISDYQELNPEGKFRIGTCSGIDVILEEFEDGNIKIIAEQKQA